MLRKKINKCKECGYDVFNRQSNAQYCKACSTKIRDQQLQKYAKKAHDKRVLIKEQKENARS